MTVQPQLQPARHGLLQVAIGVAVFVLLLFVSVAFIDRPVLRFVYHHRAHTDLFELMATPSLLPLPFALLFLAGFTLARLLGRSPGPRSALYLTLSIAVLVADAAKDELKFLIGRPWPLEWLQGGVYHLQPFTDSVYFGGFPSGHTTYIAAPMFVLWWRVPRYRPLWLGLIGVVMAGLIGYGFHFVGDCVGGFFLGLAVATAAVKLMPE